MAQMTRQRESNFDIDENSYRETILTATNCPDYKFFKED